MKAQVTAFIQSLGGTTRYSGSNRTMIIHHQRHLHDQALLDEVIMKFGRHLPFRIIAASKSSKIFSGF